MKRASCRRVATRKCAPALEHETAEVAAGGRRSGRAEGDKDACETGRLCAKGQSGVRREAPRARPSRAATGIQRYPCGVHRSSVSFMVRFWHLSSCSRARSTATYSTTRVELTPNASMAVFGLLAYVQDCIDIGKALHAGLCAFRRCLCGLTSSSSSAFPGP